MKRKLLFIFLLVCATGYSFAKDYKVSSPDGKIVVTISTGTDLKWSVACDGKEAITSVIYESPLQMLADSPSNYMKEQECTDFIVKVPVVWDDLKVLDAKTDMHRISSILRKMLNQGDKLKIEMAQGGGWVAKISLK